MVNKDSQKLTRNSSVDKIDERYVQILVTAATTPWFIPILNLPATFANRDFFGASRLVDYSTPYKYSYLFTD